MRSRFQTISSSSDRSASPDILPRKPHRANKIAILSDDESGDERNSQYVAQRHVLFDVFQ